MNPASSQGSRSLSTRKKVVFAAATTIAFFAVLEGILALVGVRPLTFETDPFVGFSSQIPLLEIVETEAGERAQTARNKLVWFNDQQLDVPKQPGTTRIFCLGGSTTFGRPYSDETSFCGWLRRLLPVADPGSRWELFNAGGVSYASYRVVEVMRELAQYEPDLFIVYTGHNEFLERRTYQAFFDEPALLKSANAALSNTRIWTLANRAVTKFRSDSGQSDDESELLPAEVDERLNHTVGPEDYHRDPNWQRQVLEHFRFNLRRMVAIAEEAGAAIVFVTPAANAKDCSPFKSEYAADVSLEAQSLCDLKFQQGISAASEEQHERAAILFGEALAIDSLPHVHYALGRSYFAMGAFADAQESFQRAIDQDVCPLRATSSFVDAVREVAGAQDVPLLDFEHRLRDLSQEELGQDVLGAEYFLDHVHPTVLGHRHLAVWLIEELSERGFLSGAKQLTDAQIELATQQLEIDPLEQGIALRNLAKVLHWAGKFEEAEPRARDALRSLPNDAESQMILADCLRWTNRVEEAVQQCEQMLLTNPFYARGYQYYGDFLIDLADFPRAREHLQLAVEALPIESRHRGAARVSLAIAHLRLSEFAAAEAILSECVKQRPRNARLLAYWAESKAGMGQTADAISLYQQSIRQDASQADTFTNLGYVFLGLEQFSDAKAAFAQALKLDAEYPRALAGQQVVDQLLQPAVQ